MTFTAPNFLFLFLPITLIIYFLVKKKTNALILIAASLVFYAFTNVYFLLILILLTWLNFYLGCQIYTHRDHQEKANGFLILGIVVNALLLLSFKFLDAHGSGLIPEEVGDIVHIFVKNYALPLGISYITFQNISYLIDVNNELHEPARDFSDFVIYTLFFPKTLVGPIMRYRDMAEPIKNPGANASQAVQGMRRFMIGLAKKALIADTLARAINPSFNLAEPQFTTGIAWFMLIAYAIQLYYDFSGFTDMALGMGQMLGFSLMENFNFPYSAQSISDFWRRWHISLSSWVRDYIFTPLEFKRRRVKFARQQTNIIIAFLVMGVWHGLTWNFIFWGLYNGLFLALEMTFLTKWLKKAWQPIRHLYTLVVVLLGWLFFRSSTLSYGFQFLGRLVGLGGAVETQPFVLTNPLPLIDPSVWLALGVGVLFSIPWLPSLLEKLYKKYQGTGIGMVLSVGYDIALIVLLVLSVGALMSATTVGNIYAGF